MLHVAGDTAILSTTSIGVVGSRVIGAATADVAQRIGRTITRHGRTLVSGGSPGVDEQAMGAALEAGGRVVGVLADSLVERLRDAATRRFVETGRLVLCTPFAPEDGYTVGRAQDRNKLIFALSDVTVVVACDNDVDSTWAGATEALHNRFSRVAVWRGAGEGSANADLESRGAIAVTDVEQLVTTL